MRTTSPTSLIIAGLATVALAACSNGSSSSGSSGTSPTAAGSSLVADEARDLSVEESTEHQSRVAELRDLILSRFEAKEEELGRALTGDEQEAILREIGHPLVVAARYRKGPDSLVGPELFP